MSKPETVGKDIIQASVDLDVNKGVDETLEKKVRVRLIDRLKDEDSTES